MWHSSTSSKKSSLRAASFLRGGPFLFLFFPSLSFATYDQDAGICQEIGCIRREIDTLNQSILELIAKRTAYVRRAGILKGPHLPSDDRKRVEDQLQLILQKAKEKNVPEEIAKSTFQSLIETSIRYQQHFKDHFFQRHENGS